MKYDNRMEFIGGPADDQCGYYDLGVMKLADHLVIVYRKDVEALEAVATAARALVRALADTNWSSWQTTASFSQQQAALIDELAELEQTK